MELTQRLECTQELYGPRDAKTCPEEIGFLGICGLRYPVKRGPNKIGRDPQSCQIVLKLESISRHHAVINILNNNEHMLMDLGSANKTKLENKVLQPYIPYPIRNGDTVQFGNVFGIFKLHEQDDDDLPMTQAIDIPDTPVAPYRISKLNKIHTTTIPESPDVSDKDESFIVPSQTKHNAFKSPTNFVKSSGKIIAIQPIGTKNIDNVYWSTSKKSDSFVSNGSFSDPNNFHKSSSSTNISNQNNIHELVTQVPHIEPNDSNVSLFEANTQIPDNNPSSPNIYNMETQVPNIDNLPNTSKIHKNSDGNDSIYKENTQIPENCKESIHDADTQMPKNQICNSICDMETQVPNDKLLNNIESSNKSIHDDNTQISHNPGIFDMETQVPSNHLPAICKIQDQNDLQFNFSVCSNENQNKSNIKGEKHDILHNSNECSDMIKKTESRSTKENNTSDDIILFDDIDSQALADDFDSQPLLSSELGFISLKSSETNKDEGNKLVKKNCLSRNNRLKSDSSTDCEDIELMLTQKISDNNIDEDLTDCEEIPTKTCKADDDITDCEDELPGEVRGKNKKEINAFEDLATQIIEDVKPNCNQVNQKAREDFAEMLTQVISNDNVVVNKTDIEDMPTQIINEEENKAKESLTPFKIPLISPLQSRKISKQKMLDSNQLNKSITSIGDEENYYVATQDIFKDLCSQSEALPGENNSLSSGGTLVLRDSKTNSLALKGKSTDASDKIDDFVDKLSMHQVCDIIGVSKDIGPLKKNPSDSSSDVEITPKKQRPFKFMETELPDSQEIKSSVSLATRLNITLSSSDSETENDSEQFTPILYHKKRKGASDAKKNLTKSLDIEALPSRVLTRVRKPTSKVLNNSETKSIAKSILKPKYLMDQEDNIDKEIIAENINRLKNKNEKSKIDRPKKTYGDTEKSNKCHSKQNDKKEKEKKRKKDKEKKAVKDDVKKDVSKLSSTRMSNECTETTHSTRSTRSRNKEKSRSDKKSNSPENFESGNSYNHSNSNKNHEEKCNQDKETRSSSRHKNSDSKEDKKLKEESNVDSLKHEDSTVYSVSSDSSVNSPCRFKRPASNVEMPLPKKLKTDLRNTKSSRSTPSRRVKKQLVLFTAFPVNEVKEKLEELGAAVVTDVMECTMVLTLQIKRTFKLLCAVGLGKPIVGPDWVQACAETNTIVDPWLYIMKDETTENRFQFNLRKTLTGKRNFLKGYKVSSTPSVLPTAQELELIVKSSGGIWKSGGRNWLCVSCMKDKHLWPELKQNGATIVNTELILGGVLRQKLEIDKNKLF